MIVKDESALENPYCDSLQFMADLAGMDRLKEWLLSGEEESAMVQFSELDPGECFHFIGESEVMMKISSTLFVRSAREPLCGKLLVQEVGTHRIMVSPCSSKPFYRGLTGEERQAIESALGDGAEILTMDQLFVIH